MKYRVNSNGGIPLIPMHTLGDTLGLPGINPFLLLGFWTLSPSRSPVTPSASPSPLLDKKETLHHQRS